LAQAILKSSLPIYPVWCALLLLFGIKGSSIGEDKYYKLSKRLREREDKLMLHFMYLLLSRCKISSNNRRRIK